MPLLEGQLVFIYSQRQTIHNCPDPYSSCYHPHGEKILPYFLFEVVLASASSHWFLLCLSLVGKRTI